MSRYRITEAPYRMYKAGISFYESGTLERNGVKIFDYYKADKISADQKSAILAWCPLAEFKGSSPEYAPELRNILICFPKAAYFRERKALLQQQAKIQARLEFTM